MLFRGVSDPLPIHVPSDVSHSPDLLYLSTAATALVLVCLSYHPKWKTSGYLPGFCSALSCVLMNNYVHSASHEEHLPFGLCMLARTSCLTIAAVVLGKAQAVQLAPDTTDVLTLVGVRAFAGMVCTGSLFVAFCYAPVLHCLAVYYSNSVFSGLIAQFFLNEPLEASEWVSMLVGVSAVLVILRSSAGSVATEADAQPWVGLGFAALAALAESFAGLANRRLRGQVHHLCLMFTQAALGFCVFFLLAFVFPEHFRPESLPLQTSQSRVLAGVVLSSFMLQITLSQAYMLEKTGPLQVFNNACVVAPQLCFDAAMGQTHNTATWFGLVLLAFYMVVSWRAQADKNDSASVPLNTRSTTI